MVAQEHLPTPYSAGEIRDAFRVGFVMTTQNWTPAGEEVSVTRVESWSPEEVQISVYFLDASGKILDGEQTFDTTWEELRGHALFPNSTSTRDRIRLETALGELEGWLYDVRGEGGARSEFFFADGLPGPPVLYRHYEGDTKVFQAEQIERQEAP